MEPGTSAPAEAEARASGAALLEVVGLGPGEQLRRAAALHQACARLLRVPPEHRPRSLAALCRLLRGSCAARTASASPLDLAAALGVPERVQRELTSKHPSATGELEPLPEEALNIVRHQWAALHARGWVARSSAAEVARWIESQSFLRSSYAPSDVVHALCALGLVERAVVDSAVRVDCSQMTEAACARALPRPAVPGALATGSCFVTRAVSVPPRCKSALIGRGGSNRADVLRAVRAKLSEAGGVLRVGLSVQDHVAVLTLVFAKHPAIPLDSRQARRADAAAGVLKEELEAIYRGRLQASRLRRAALQQRRSEQGQDYHQELRHQRRLQKELPAAARALALPDTGVDGFGSVFIRRGGGKPCGERSVRKAALRLRRCKWLRQKRRELLRLCAAGEARGLDLGDAAWREPERGTARMRACQQLLTSAHLSGPRGCIGVGEPSRRCNRGAARRLRRHLASVATAAGWLAPRPHELEAVHGRRDERRPTPPAPQRRAARKAKGRRGLAIEIAESLRAVH